MLRPGEKTEPLGGGIRIIVSEEHKFWTDTILLANFAMPKPSDRACDLGSGCGPIPLIWFRHGCPEFVSAVEIQDDACSMLQRSLEMNHLEDKAEVICTDLRELKGKLPFSAYDVVVCNPPYKPDGKGIKSSSDSGAIARHGSMCTMQDITAAAASLLKFQGKLFMCQRPENLCDVIAAMRENKLEPKRLRMVQQRISKPPKLFLIEARRSGKPGGLIIEPALLIENEQGGFSDEMLAIYGEYKEGYI